MPADEITVEVQVAPELAGTVSAEDLQAAAEAVLRHESRAGQVTLVLTDDEGIRDLNRDFLGIDAPTDVLAFGAQEDGGPFIAAPEVGGYLGDVIISYPRAVTEAEEQGYLLEQELNLLVVHGVLHLLGYDHAEKEGKAAMWAQQEAILNSL